MSDLFGRPSPQPAREQDTIGQGYQALLRQNRMMQNSIQLLQGQMQYMESSAEIWRQSSVAATAKATRLERLLYRLVQALAPAEYARERIADKERVNSWTPEQMAEFLQEKVKEREARQFQEAQELNAMVGKLTQTIEDLYAQIDEYKNRIANLPAELPATPAMVPRTNEEGEQTEEPADVPPFDLRSLDEGHVTLIKVIGKTGVFRALELEQNQEVINQFGANQMQRRKCLAELQDWGILDNEKVHVGARGHYYATFRLTKLGKWVYTKITEEEPVESVLDALIRNHASPEHGVLILDTKLVFERAGFFVEDNPKNNTFKLDDGFIRFDLVVTKSMKQWKIECERGTHTQADFNEKMRKWMQVTKNFFFVCPNKEAKEATKVKFFAWVAEQQNVADYCARFITLEDLKRDAEGGWETFDYRS